MEAKVAGGFLEIPTGKLVWAWQHSRSGQGGLGTGDFRCWLAAHEMVARRMAARGRAPKFTDAELVRLLGVTERTARASVRRLVAAGLIVFREAEIAFPDPPDSFALGSLFAETISKGKGSVAVPRRLLRFLVRGARPALIATAIGTLLRCLSRRRSGWDGRGRIKSSWVATAFGVSIAGVKRAKAELIALGWIAPEPSPVWVETRYGRAYRIDLEWKAPGSRLIPPRADSGSKLIPPDQTGIPYREDLDLKPRTPPEAAGACAGEGCPEPQAEPIALEAEPAPVDAIRVPAPVAASTAALPPPRLSDIKAEDLTDLDRLATLQTQAAQVGLIGTSEADRLKVVALAEHCRRIGKNPPALFAALLRKKEFSYITAAEEDAARRRLRSSWTAGSAGDTDRSAAPAATPSIPPTPHPARRSTFVAAAQPAGPSSLASILARVGGLAFGAG